MMAKPKPGGPPPAMSRTSSSGSMDLKNKWGTRPSASSASAAPKTVFSPPPAKDPTLAKPTPTSPDAAPKKFAMSPKPGSPPAGAIPKGASVKSVPGSPEAKRPIPEGAKIVTRPDGSKVVMYAKAPEQKQPPPGAKIVVEEKFGEQNFRVLSEMRGKILYYNPKKFKKSCQNHPKRRQNAVKI